MGDPTPSPGAAFQRAVKEHRAARGTFNAAMPDALGSPINRLLHESRRKLPAVL